MAYDQMLHFIANDENWPDMEAELRGRGVRDLLPPASEGWGKVLFSVCLSVHTSGGVPHLRFG